MPGSTQTAEDPNHGGECNQDKTGSLEAVSAQRSPRMAACRSRHHADGHAAYRPHRQRVNSEQLAHCQAFT
jgi:hypothetical protein